MTKTIFLNDGSEKEIPMIAIGKFESLNEAASKAGLRLLKRREAINAEVVCELYEPIHGGHTALAVKA